jgi:hypothetical protein
MTNSKSTRIRSKHSKRSDTQGKDEEAPWRGISGGTIPEQDTGVKSIWKLFILWSIIGTVFLPLRLNQTVREFLSQFHGK